MAPLGYGRAPFLELLSARPEVSYKGVGALSEDRAEISVGFPIECDRERVARDEGQ